MTWVPPTGRTPNTFPQQQQQSGWQQWLPLITGTGAGLAASYLQNRTISNQNQALQQRTAQMDKLAQEEQARKDYYSSILMPNILRGLGQRSPQVIAEARRRMMQYGGGGGGRPALPPPPTDSTQQMSGGGYQPYGPGASYDAAWGRATDPTYQDPNDLSAWWRT